MKNMSEKEKIREKDLDFVTKLSKIESKLDDHIHGCPKNDIYNLSKELERQSSSLETLKKFIIPIISITNIVILSILTSMMFSMQNKFDKFLEKYYQDKNLILETKINDIKKNSKYFSLIDTQIKKIEENSERIKKIEERIIRVKNKIEDIQSYLYTDKKYK